MNENQGTSGKCAVCVVCPNYDYDDYLVFTGTFEECKVHRRI